MNRVQQRFIADALKQKEKLNDWEKGFIDSLSKKPSDYELTASQNKTLNSVQRKL